MCICENIKIDSQERISTGNWLDLFLERFSYGYYITAISDGNVSIEINYCPLCGRKLYKEEK